MNSISKGRRFCNVRCKSKYFVDARRKKLKRLSIAYKGGGCEVCGYSKSEAALQFHHLDPASKDFSLSGKGITRSWERIQSELNKCVLLCANCHAEIHARQHSSVKKRGKSGEFGERLSNQRRAKPRDARKV